MDGKVGNHAVQGRGEDGLIEQVLKAVHSLLKLLHLGLGHVQLLYGFVSFGPWPAPGEPWLARGWRELPRKRLFLRHSPGPRSAGLSSCRRRALSPGEL